MIVYAGQFTGKLRGCQIPENGFYRFNQNARPRWGTLKNSPEEEKRAFTSKLAII